MKKIGVVGCGDISGIYLKNITGMFSQNLAVAGVYDIVRERAEKRAAEFGAVKVYGSSEELLSDPGVDIVLNLTRPYEHYAVSEAALNAGKHVYTEKPLGADFSEGQKLNELAKSKNLLIGGAPDTFLGAGIQTCKKLIEEGAIGTPVGASAFMVCRGHESWHPDPEFYYKRGGGPMMDMGPYYITALVTLLGGVKSVTGAAVASFPERTVTSAAKRGTVVKVETPTHIAGVLEFVSGAVGTVLTTFDVHAAQVPRMEVYGSAGTLSVPDPNTFGGPVLLYTPETKEFREMPLAFGYAENSRGIGIADMASHIETGSPFRASGAQILHVLEVMTGFSRAYERRGFAEMVTAL
ncbi:MAG: Gfo/Idh/MocA family oxidoreductase [Oscillospiraceae bacterium]|jgi:predicted dehydrogenase|nr:Gfo/Idh/MocA family oxidoreductase [Oscillospiraceae bacterium]